jgi:cell division septation protein DedD
VAEPPAPVTERQTPVTEHRTPVTERRTPVDTPPRMVETAPAVKPALRSAQAGELAVHVGSFQDAARAQRLVQRLSGAGFAVFEIREVIDDQPWVRVYAGPFATLAMAEQARERLTGGGIVAYARVVTVGQ